MNTNFLVQKLWNYCNVLRDEGMGYGDYVEQLTYLLFRKMADGRSHTHLLLHHPKPCVHFICHSSVSADC